VRRVTEIMENIIQNVRCYGNIGCLEELLTYCLISFPFGLRYLMNAECLIDRYSLTSVSALIVTNNFDHMLTVHYVR